MLHKFTHTLLDENSPLTRQDSASLEIGVFRVTPTRGVVAVCGKVDVKVESLSMAEGNFMEVGGLVVCNKLCVCVKFNVGIIPRNFK